MKTGLVFKYLGTYIFATSLAVTPLYSIPLREAVAAAEYAGFGFAAGEVSKILSKGTIKVLKDYMPEAVNPKTLQDYLPETLNWVSLDKMQSTTFKTLFLSAIQTVVLNHLAKPTENYAKLDEKFYDAGSKSYLVYEAYTIASKLWEVWRLQNASAQEFSLPQEAPQAALPFSSLVKLQALMYKNASSTDQEARTALITLYRCLPEDTAIRKTIKQTCKEKLIYKFGNDIKQLLGEQPREQGVDTTELLKKILFNVFVGYSIAGAGQTTSSKILKFAPEKPELLSQIIGKNIGVNAESLGSSFVPEPINKQEGTIADDSLSLGSKVFRAYKAIPAWLSAWAALKTAK